MFGTASILVPGVTVPYLTHPRYISTLPFPYKRFLRYFLKRRAIDGDAGIMRYPVLSSLGPARSVAYE